MCESSDLTSTLSKIVVIFYLPRPTRTVVLNGKNARTLDSVNYKYLVFNLQTLQRRSRFIGPTLCQGLKNVWKLVGSRTLAKGVQCVVCCVDK